MNRLPDYDGWLSSPAEHDAPCSKCRQCRRDREECRECLEQRMDEEGKFECRICERWASGRVHFRSVHPSIDDGDEVAICDGCNIEMVKADRLKAKLLDIARDGLKEFLR